MDNLENEALSTQHSGGAVLECKDLSKSYGNMPALNHINFSIEPGRIVGLLGPNGSGKTTLIKLVNGLLTPSSGEVLVDGMAPGKQTRAEVSFLPDRTCLPTWMTATQLLDFYQDFYADFRRDAAEEMLEHLGINKKQTIKQMSKGTREKVQLIMVMSRSAKLYLLDEPIGGVDPATRDYILTTIITNYNPEAAVIISTHLISDVEKVLDEVIFINQGQMVLQSSVDQIREEKGMSVDALFREVFKC
ncbi:MAG: ABC transporter ATP-binding protein [Oscillibacter sp.]|jgi:ABC-2 type transport system ATP-binding protein|nr:ABC transporter ATP-binding protein [Oscillibacter sp.]